MKCPSCGYTSFDYLTRCRKCGSALSPIPVFRYLHEDRLTVETVLGEARRETEEVFAAGAGAISEDGMPDFRDVFAEAETAGALPAAAEIDDDERIFVAPEDIPLLREEPARETREEQRAEPSPEGPLLPGLSPAGVPARFFAFSVDFLFTLAAAVFALGSGAYLIGETSFPGFGEFVSIWGPTCLSVYLLATAYFFLLPVLCGTTLGNAAAGIRVVRRDGSGAGPARSFLRWIGSLFSVATLFLGFAPALFGRERRSLNDRLLGTFVVKTSLAGNAD